MKKIAQFHSLEELIQAAADLFIRVGVEAINTSGRFSVVLSGGNTPQPLYRILAGETADHLDWNKIHFFWGDERPVPPDHQDSNFKQAHHSLLRPLGIKEENIHRIQAELPPPDAARLYEEEILDWFQGNPPAFDLILLGMGSDGHTASLFPKTALVSGDPAQQQRLVAANWVPQLDSWRISFTPSLINRGRNVLFLVNGKNKAAPLAKVLEGSRDPVNFPSQLIKPMDGNLYWFLDREAGVDLLGQDQN